MDREKAFPFPEAIAGKPWDIQEAVPEHNAFADPTRRIIQVPLGDNPLHEAIRTHEMAHAKWSKPFTKEQKQFIRENNIGQDLFQLVEDQRMRIRLSRVGIPPEPILTENIAAEINFSRSMGQTDAAYIAALLVAARGCQSDTNQLRALFEQELALDTRIDNAVFYASDTLLQRKKPGMGSTLASARILAELRATGGLPAPSPTTIEVDSPWVPWGSLEVETPPLNLPLPAKLRKRKPKGMTEGTHLRFPQRYCTDKAIFSRRTKRPAGGSILLDASGSMMLDSYLILKILESYPAALIAFYSGHPDGYGWLRVVTKKGRRAAEDYLNPKWHGNVVDGPALRWLAKQEEPRIWISDGQVTGVGEDQGTNMFADCQSICRQANIEQWVPAAPYGGHHELAPRTSKVDIYGEYGPR